GIDKMRRQMRWIEPMRDRRRFGQKTLLFATDHAQLRQTRDRALIFSSRQLGMSPWIESSRRLRQTREKNRFGQSKTAGGFTEVRTRGCFGPETTIAVAASIQIFGEDAFLAPAALDFPGNDCFIKLAQPTAPLPAGSHLHQLLCNGRCARDDAMCFQISCACRRRCPPVDACVFVETMIFESDGHAREPLSHFVEATRQLRARLRRSDLGDLAAATVEQCKSSYAWLLKVRGQRQPPDRHRYREDTSRTNYQ